MGFPMEGRRRKKPNNMSKMKQKKVFQGHKPKWTGKPARANKKTQKLLREERKSVKHKGAQGG